MWMGPLYLRLLMPLTLPGPIIFLRGAAEILGWAHCIYSRSCCWLRMGLLFLWEVQPMSPDGPIALTAAAATAVFA